MKPQQFFIGRVIILAVFAATTANTGCTYKSRRNLWHMQADHNSFETPSLQVEQKYRTTNRPSKVQQYRWMYNHWPDEVATRDVVVAKTGGDETPEFDVASTDNGPSKPRRDTSGSSATLRNTRTKSESASSTLARQTIEPWPLSGPSDSSQPAAESWPSHIAAEEPNPFQRPHDESSVRVIPVPNHDVIAKSTHPSTNVPNRADNWGLNSAHQLPSGTSAEHASSSVHQAWSFEKHADRPLTQVSATAGAENHQPTQAGPSDLIQRTVVPNSRHDSAQSNPSREWWGGGSSAPKVTPARHESNATPDEDLEYSVQGMFEIR